MPNILIHRMRVIDFYASPRQSTILQDWADAVEPGIFEKFHASDIPGLRAVDAAGGVAASDGNDNEEQDQER
ncbi:hypothetical protein O1611_g804 [Lasiodiplodia mahajangana]|uniref:Uncharacterized protein n=1 Tax=Lasiodiplodia mahajangana TaxID=1108764 RepID=A0ACC2JZB4_9PEZI|nr:hypothetical protein O1611_g804 [Lasiodiplodia mahajangana]